MLAARMPRRRVVFDHLSLAFKGGRGRIRIVKYRAELFEDPYLLKCHRQGRVSFDGLLLTQLGQGNPTSGLDY